MNPTAAFTRLKDEPKWIIVFIIYCLFSFLLAWTLRPYTQKLLAAPTVDTVSLISITIFSMVYTIVMAILLSVILTITARIAKIKSGIKFKHICSAFFHIMLIRLMTFFVNAGLLPVFRDIEDIHTTVDARIIPGLHLLDGIPRKSTTFDVSCLHKPRGCVVRFCPNNRYPYLRRNQQSESTCRSTHHLAIQNDS